MKYIKIFLKDYVLFYFGFSIIFTMFALQSTSIYRPTYRTAIAFCIYALFAYIIFQKFNKLQNNVWHFHMIFTIIVTILLGLCLFFTQGNMLSPLWYLFYVILVPFLPIIFILALSNAYLESFLLINGILIINCIYYYFLLKRKID